MTAYEHGVSPNPETQSGAPATSAVPSRYPRHGLVPVVRQLLVIFGWMWLILFGAIIISERGAISRRGIVAVPRFFSGPGAPDQLLWSYAVNLAFFLLLLGGTLWATYDWIAEEKAELSKPRVSFTVQAEQRWRRDLEAARARGDWRAEYKALGNLGYWLSCQEKDTEALPYLEQSLALAREMGDRSVAFHDLLELARIARRAGDLNRAEALFRESWALECEFEIGGPVQVAHMYAILGEFLGFERDKREEGRQLLDEAARRFQVIGDEEDEQRMRDLLRQLGNDQGGDPAPASS